MRMFRRKVQGQMFPDEALKYADWLLAYQEGSTNMEFDHWKFSCAFLISCPTLVNRGLAEGGDHV